MCLILLEDSDDMNLKCLLLALQFMKVLQKELDIVENERESFIQEFSEVSALSYKYN